MSVALRLVLLVATLPVHGYHHQVSDGFKFVRSGQSVISNLTKSAQSDVVTTDDVPKPRVLLGDDNPAMLDFVSKMLADEYEIVGAVREGRTVLREYPFCALMFFSSVCPWVT